MNLTREGSVLSSSARVAMMHAIVGVSSCGVAAYCTGAWVGGYRCYPPTQQHHDKSRKVGVGAARIKVGVDWKWKSNHN